MSWTRPEYRDRHWRVVLGDGFSFNIDRVPYIVQYRWLWIWWTVHNPDWIGAMCFSTNQDAVEWINQRSPRSIIQCEVAPILKPRGWNDRELASGRYGRQEQADALIRLSQR